MKTILTETKLLLSEQKIGNIQLYKYQKEAVETILNNQRGIFILSAGTGMGKTAVSVATTLMSSWRKTLAIYPTNELIKNQKASIEKLAKLMGAPETEVQEVYRHSILEFIREEEYIHSKSQAMINLLKGKLTTNKRFLLTNPDTLHLILQFRYGSKKFRTKGPAVVLNALSDYRFLVIDEFHYYKERMLNNLLLDLCLAIAMGMFDKILLMTATPDYTINQFLTKISDFLDKNGIDVPIFLLSQGEEKEEITGEEVTVTHPIELTLQKGNWDNIEEILALINELKDEIKTSNNNGDIVPLCVIVNSVIQARKIAAELKEEFNVVEIHGLVPQSLRQIKQDTEIIVGTNAIEVGIDFDTKNLIFEANEGASFLQRLGRAGRKRPAKVWGFIPEYVYNYISRRAKENVSKEEFAELVQEAYLEEPQRYLNSTYAKYEVSLYLQDLKNKLMKSKVAESTIDIEKIFGLIEYVFDLKNGYTFSLKPELSIIDEKRDAIVMFRNGEPQVLVHDTSAEKEGFFPFYFSPVSRIIYRAAKILDIKTGAEVSKFIHRKKVTATEEKEKVTLNHISIDLREQAKRNEKVVMVQILGYLNKRRTAKFRYVERISLTEPVVGVNEDKIGYDLELTSDYEVEKLGMMFEDQLYTIIPKAYTKGLDWRYTNYEAISMENQNKGQVFFGADCLIGLAYMEAIKKEEE